MDAKWEPGQRGRVFDLKEQVFAEPANEVLGPAYRVFQGGPYPSFAGQAPPPSQGPIPSQNTGQRQSAPLTANTTGGALPPLTSGDRTKFTKIFVGCGPQNGLVSGDKARDVFVKSQLDYDKLGQIWYYSARHHTSKELIEDASGISRTPSKEGLWTWLISL